MIGRGTLQHSNSLNSLVDFPPNLGDSVSPWGMLYFFIIYGLLKYNDKLIFTVFH